MLNVILGFLLLYGVKSNVVISLGSGALLFQKEKQYRKFRLISSFYLMLGVIVCLIISYFLHNYIYKPYDMLYLNVVVSVLMVGIYNILVSKVFANMSNFNHYLYEKSHSFAIDFVFILSLIFSADMSQKMLDFMLMALIIGIVMFVSNIVFGFFIEDSNKSSIDKHYLNVPSRLFMLAMLSILLYYASLLIK